MERERGAFRVDALTSISGEDGRILARIEWNSFLHWEAHAFLLSISLVISSFFFPFLFLELPSRSAGGVEQSYKKGMLGPSNYLFVVIVIFSIVFLACNGSQRVDTSQACRNVLASKKHRPPQVVHAYRGGLPHIPDDVDIYDDVVVNRGLCIVILKCRASQDDLSVSVVELQPVRVS